MATEIRAGTIASLCVELGVDITPLEEGFKSARKALKKTAESLSSMGAKMAKLEKLAESDK